MGEAEDKEKKNVQALYPGPSVVFGRFSWEETLALTSRNCHLEEDLQLQKEACPVLVATTKGLL